MHFILRQTHKILFYSRIKNNKTLKCSVECVNVRSQHYSRSLIYIYTLTHTLLHTSLWWLQSSSFIFRGADWMHWAQMRPRTHSRTGNNMPTMTRLAVLVRHTQKKHLKMLRRIRIWNTNNRKFEEKKNIQKAYTHI